VGLVGGLVAKVGAPAFGVPSTEELFPLVGAYFGEGILDCGPTSPRSKAFFGDGNRASTLTVVAQRCGNGDVVFFCSRHSVLQG